MLILLAGLLIKIDYQVSSSGAENVHQPIYQYFIGGIVILIGSLSCEACIIAILGEVSSPVAALGVLNAGLASGYGATIGRALGNLSVAIAAVPRGVNYISLYMYSAYSIVVFLLIVLIIVIYRRMEKLTYAQLYFTESIHHKNHKEHIDRHTRSSLIKNS
jgi:hypothetical protein